MQNTPAKAPIVLDIADVAVAAKKAYDEGRLAAQQRGGVCAYRDRGFPCAIGAALADETAHRWDGLDCSSLEFVFRRGWAKSKNRKGLIELQQAHDGWVSGYGTEADFLAVLTRYLPRGEA